MTAFATALRDGAFLQLIVLRLDENRIGDAGMRDFAAALSGSLPALIRLDLDQNQITDAGCATLVSAIDGGKMPAIKRLSLWSGDTPASDQASRRAVYDAVRRATARRSSY